MLHQFNMIKNKDSWGIVATVKAPPECVLDFAAHHLELGADVLHIYLDDSNAQSYAALKRHPKIDVTCCDDAYWQETVGNRPGKQERRQTANAMHAYQKPARTDWLTHIDVDEFLHPLSDLGTQLANLPDDCITAQIRPVEALSNDGITDPARTYFKACHIKRPVRLRETALIYPKYGKYLDGGFLSHSHGKVIFRTAVDKLSIRIHRVFLNEMSNPGLEMLTGCELYHMHAQTWEHWYAHFPQRHKYGAYKVSHKPNIDVEDGGASLHDLFAEILATQGKPGLQQFYNEVCCATPDLRNRLDSYGHLRELNLDLPRKRQQQFPGWQG